MKKFLKLGQKGFTLIELLVVVAILGVLAAVIIPNVANFIGMGSVEAANTEAHNVQTAVVAYMADNSLMTIPSGSVVGPEEVEDIGTADNNVKSFLTNPGSLQADYTISAEGAITEAEPITDGKWKDLSWSDTEGWHKAA